MYTFKAYNKFCLMHTFVKPLPNPANEYFNPSRNLLVVLCNLSLPPLLIHLSMSSVSLICFLSWYIGLHFLKLYINRAILYVYSTVWLFLHGVIVLRFIHSEACIHNPFFFYFWVLNRYTIVFLSIHLLMGTGAAPSFLLLQIKLLWSFLY